MSMQSILNATGIDVRGKHNLDLGDLGELEDDVVDEIVQLVEGNKLRSLSLSTSYTRMCHCSTIGESVATNSSLETFTVYGSADEETNWCIPTIIEHNKTLRVLRIHHQKVYYLEGDIRSAIMSNTTLRVLDLNGHRLGDCHLQRIAEGLKGNRTLRSLNIYTHYDLFMTPAYMKAFVNAMETNFTLLELKMNDMGDTEASTEAIRKALRRNRRFDSRLNQVLLFQTAHQAHRDAKCVFKAAAEGRPMELAKRLRLGKLAGGVDVLVDGETALAAAEAGGHVECASVLRACMKGD